MDASLKLEQILIENHLDDGTLASLVVYRSDYGWDEGRNSETRKTLTKFCEALGLATAFPMLEQYQLANIKTVSVDCDHGIPNELYLEYEPVSLKDHR